MWGRQKCERKKKNGVSGANKDINSWGKWHPKIKRTGVKLRWIISILPHMTGSSSFSSLQSRWLLQIALWGTQTVPLSQAKDPRGQGPVDETQASH